MSAFGASTTRSLDGYGKSPSIKDINAPRTPPVWLPSIDEGNEAPSDVSKANGSNQMLRMEAHTMWRDRNSLEYAICIACGVVLGRLIDTPLIIVIASLTIIASDLLRGSDSTILSKCTASQRHSCLLFLSRHTPSPAQSNCLRWIHVHIVASLEESIAKHESDTSSSAQDQTAYSTLEVQDDQTDGTVSTGSGTSQDGTQNESDWDLVDTRSDMVHKYKDLDTDWEIVEEVEDPEVVTHGNSTGIISTTRVEHTSRPENHLNPGTRVEMDGGFNGGRQRYPSLLS